MRIRLLSLLLCLFSGLASADKYFKTNSLLTCMENSEFTSDYFSVYFYPSNNSAVFYIDGSSSISDKVVADVDLIVYGLNVYQDTLDLCSLGYDTICPLTSGRINVDGSYTITSNSLTNAIPSVAYTIPDLDAYVRVVVYAKDDTQKETPLACLKAIISNGKTVQTRYAGWPIACVSGFGLIVSSFVSIMGQSTTAAHIASNAASLFIYFQNLAIMAMMGVASVPPIAASWAQNFMWTLGIIEADFMQDIFYWYVQSTGGDVTATLDNKDVISISVQKFVKFLFKRAISVESASDADSLQDSNLYSTDQYNLGSKTLVLRGIQRVAYLAGIEISNLFLTSITFFLFIGFILIFLISIFRGFCEILIRSGTLKDTKFAAFREKWALVTKGALFRYIAITFPQIVLLCLWEFTQNNGAGCIIFAVVIFICSFVLMLYATIKILITGMRSLSEHKNAARLLFGEDKVLYKYGFLYSQYKASHFWWIGVSFFYLFLRALLIAVLQSEGKVCACLIFAMEIIYTVATIWIRPFMDKRTNVFNIFISIVNLINSIFFMFYSNVFGQPPVVSSVAAVVYFVLNAIFALILLIFTIFTCTMALIHRNPDSRYSQVKDDRNAFIPKEATYDQDEFELAALGATAMQGQDRKSYVPESESYHYDNKSIFAANDISRENSSEKMENDNSGSNVMANPFENTYDDEVSGSQRNHNIDPFAGGYKPYSG
ncbi:flavin adenine dinucleotide transporter [Martiniozyma asiatica (nom. inval.)]|nr:flavin adenine dinucleotide transporter [Martiniozyma asiatica]